MRDHADRRTFPMQLAKQLDNRIAILRAGVTHYANGPCSRGNVVRDEAASNAPKQQTTAPASQSKRQRLTKGAPTKRSMPTLKQR